MSAILPHMVCGLSANLKCRSETCCTRLAENTGRKNVAKNRPRIDNRKNLVKHQYLLHKSSQYGELRPTNGGDRFTSLGYPCKFQLVSRLGSVTARHLVVGVSQTLRRWTEGTTYIRQGDHHVGHWPIFLVIITFRESRRWRENSGHGRLCMSVCLSLAACPHYCMYPDVTWANGRECP